MSKIAKIIENKMHYDGVTLVERMKECHTPAVSIALVENLEISDVFTHGEKRRGKKESVTADTLFQAASISKPVFAVAVMRLAERGTLDIDTNISEYIPGFAVPSFDGQKHKITLRHLLSHHAGLNLHGFAGYQHGQKIPTVEQILSGAHPSNHIRLKQFREPEVGFQYSGGGYVLAQKVVTDVCTADFCGLMNDLVFSPLSMARSTYAQPLPKERLGEIAFGYNSHNLQLPGGYNIMPELSAAGLWTTPSDLARLGIEIMKTVRGQSAFLNKKSAQAMTSKAYENSPYGVGFGVTESKKGMTFGHGGDNNGYHAYMVFCPDDGTGIVVMQNSNIGAGIRNEVTNAFRDVYGW